MKASKTQKGFRPPPTGETREIICRDNVDFSQFEKCASRTFRLDYKRKGRPVFLQSFIGVQIENIRRFIVYLLLRKYRIKNNNVNNVCKDSDFAGEVKLGSKAMLNILPQLRLKKTPWGRRPTGRPKTRWWEQVVGYEGDGPELGRCREHRVCWILGYKMAVPVST